MAPLAVVTFQPPAQALDHLQVPHVVETDPAQWRALARDAQALCCLLTDRVDAALLAHAGSLKVIATASVGVDHVDVEAATARGIWVCHTPGVLTQATADLTLALILAASRRVPEGEALLRGGRFQGWRHDMLLGLELGGATLGIVGMGRIGRAVASRAAAFGMEVLSSDPGAPDGPGRPVDLEELCRVSDVVTLHCPLTPATRHLFDRARIRSMKPGAILVNTARGAVVDEEALADALHDGHLAAAGLDVYEHEPAVHPRLLTAPRVVLLPHLGSATLKTRTAMATLAFVDATRVVRGLPPLHPFNHP
jgi:glyoxylate reductase